MILTRKGCLDGSLFYLSSFSDTMQPGWNDGSRYDAGFVLRSLDMAH